MTPQRVIRKADHVRDQVNAAAQDAFRRMVRHYVQTGEWDRHLSAEWHAAEAVLDAIDDEPAPTRFVDPGDHFVGMPA